MCDVTCETTTLQLATDLLGLGSRNTERRLGISQRAQSRCAIVGTVALLSCSKMVAPYFFPLDIVKLCCFSCCMNLGKSCSTISVCLIIERGRIGLKKRYTVCKKSNLLVNSFNHNSQGILYLKIINYEFDQNF